MDAGQLQLIKNKYDVIGNDPALNDAISLAVAIAPADIPVLVTGESGVGKEVIPRIIHQNSRRRTGKYFIVNCGAIPEGTVESELFGHEKGSFTGASEMRKGYFEEADGGTIFLDEIGELPMSVQAKLLRVMQFGVFKRVGSSKDLKTDVRIVAATNKNLPYEISKDKFRSDLYYRFSAVTISLPALRERPEDINILFRKFASDFSAQYGVPRVTLTEDASILLKKYRWPGNVRQLKNVTEVICQLETYSRQSSEKCVVDAAALKRYLPDDSVSQLPSVAVTHTESPDSAEKYEALIRAIYQLRQDVDYLKGIVLSGNQPVVETPRAIANSSVRTISDSSVRENVEDPEEQEIVPDDSQDPLSIEKVNYALIERALRKHNGNRKLAAQELGISERSLYRKLDKIKNQK